MARFSAHLTWLSFVKFAVLSNCQCLLLDPLKKLFLFYTDAQAPYMTVIVFKATKIKDEETLIQDDIGYVLVVHFLK